MVLLREDGDLVNEIRVLDIDVHFMHSITLFPYNRSLLKVRTLRAYWKIKKSFADFENMLKTLNPDAVYINTMMLAPYLKVAKKNGCKTAIHLREHWPQYEHIKQLSRLQNIISNYADKIVAINSFSASLVKNREVSVVYDWIDLSNRYEYRPFDEIFDEDTSQLKVYLFTGGLQRIKGAAEVVDMFRKRIPDKNKRLLMVDVASQPNYNGIKNKVKYYLSKFGIYTYEYRVRKKIDSDDRIVCIPATYAIKHIMEQAYCYISYFTIPHANLALAESIIVGTVPVAAKTEESVEYSNGGSLAVLYELGDQNDLLEKLNELDANYEAIKAKIAKDGHRIAEMFNKERNVVVLESVFEELLYN